MLLAGKSHHQVYFHLLQIFLLCLLCTIEDTCMNKTYYKILLHGTYEESLDWCSESTLLGFGEAANWFMGKVNDLEWPCNICFYFSEYLFGLFLYPPFLFWFKKLPNCWSLHNHSNSRLIIIASKLWNISVSTQQMFISCSYPGLGRVEGFPVGYPLSRRVPRCFLLQLSHLEPSVPWDKSMVKKANPVSSWLCFCLLPIGLTPVSWPQPNSKGSREAKSTWPLGGALTVTITLRYSEFSKKKWPGVCFVDYRLLCQILMAAR